MAMDSMVYAFRVRCRLRHVRANVRDSQASNTPEESKEAWCITPGGQTGHEERDHNETHQTAAYALYRGELRKVIRIVNPD